MATANITARKYAENTRKKFIVAHILVLEEFRILLKTASGVFARDSDAE